ncbi:MAG: conjugal transfer protein TraD [Flavobacterium sp.]|uniref:conjugal transfer protein TraD n=1 Tax=Flavobacterium sp. TaxID=239 RepID=UPI002FCA185B
MEKVVIICLIIIVLILVYDRHIFKSTAEKNCKLKKANPNLPDIMGQPKVQPSPYPSDHNFEQVIIYNTDQIDPDELDIEYDENETLYRPIPKEELDRAFTNTTNLEEEEEDWYQYHIAHSDNGFAQGVTFEELGTVNNLLQKKQLNQEQKVKAIDIVQRLQGTELFSLLEDSIEGASAKIAKLLDSKLSSVSNHIPPTEQKSDLRDFDIGEFI